MKLDMLASPSVTAGDSHESPTWLSSHSKLNPLLAAPMSATAVLLDALSHD